MNRVWPRALQAAHARLIVVVIIGMAVIDTGDVNYINYIVGGYIHTHIYIYMHVSVYLFYFLIFF